MTDEEIQEFIKSKSITQDTYVAPTIKTHVDTRAPAMAQVAQTVKQPTLKETIKQYKDTVNNSAVKKYGLNVSNLITDLANTKEAENKVLESIPVIGNVFKLNNTIKSTARNAAMNMGTGALKAAESAADTVSDLYFNPRERALNYAYDFVTKGKKTADENLKDLKETQKRDIQKNITQDIFGYDDVADQIEKDSLVKRDNLAGQVTQGVGGMVPALVLGQAFGATPNLTNLKGLAGKERLAAALSNVGKTYAAQLPSNLMLGAQSYGGGMEEALNDGANMNQARLYGLANAAIEQGTEMLTGGVPGLEGKGGLDQLVDPLIDKTGKGYLNALLKAGYGAAGEGLEEYASEMLNPLAKKIYSNEKIDWDETRKRARQAGLVGAATGAILNTPSNIQNFNDARANNKINNQSSNVQSDTKANSLNYSDDLKSEIQSKTRKNQQGKQDVQLLSTEEIMPLLKDGGYRNTEQYNNLINNIKNNGIENAIELTQNNDGSYEIKNGNHRLKAAIEMGLSEVPVKIVSGNVETLNNPSYNEDVSNYVEKRFNNGIDAETETVDRSDDNAKIIEGSNNKNSELLGEGITTAANDRLSQSLQGYNNGPSSTSTSGENNQQSNVKGTSDSSFSNENIAAKKDNEVLTLKNKKGQELKLKQDKNNPNVYEREVKIPKDNKSIVPKETIESQVAKLKDGTVISNNYSNITEKSKFITQENRDKLSQEDIWRYAPQTNLETMQKAMDKIGTTQKSLEAAYGDFLTKEAFTPEDAGVGWILLKRFQDAGNYEAMVQVAKKMRNTGATGAGRTVQMFNLQSRLTPEGMVYFAQSELAEAEQLYNKGKSLKQIEKHRKDFELTGEEIEYIKSQMEKIQGMEDGDAKNVEMAKINKMLSKKLPHQKGDSVKSWMRLAMLGNFKTQVRNIAGNALITPINAIADVPAAMVDKAIAKKTGTRTVGAPSLGGLVAYGKGVAQGGKYAWRDYRMGIDTKNVDMNRFDIAQQNPFVETHEGIARVLNPISKGLNLANRLLDLQMSGGDRIFYEGAKEASLYNQMKLNNVDTPTQDMIDIAENEGAVRTWNDSNGYTQFVLNTRRALNKINAFGYGLGDVLIPFAKTPANLTKAIVDYSPVGMADAIFKTKSIKNAIETGQITPQMQHDFAQKLGKGVAGTMLYALGYGLAKSGITSGSKDDDKDVANFIQNTMGIQPYSVKIGDKSFTYDWAQPIAAPIAITADAYKNLTRKSDENFTKRVMNTMLDVANTGINVLLQQSFLQGISEVLNNNEGVANGIMEQVMGLPARAIPTFAQQINNMFDRTQRVSYENDQPINTAWNQVLSKTPFSKTLAPKVDTLGNEVKRYGGDKNDITYFLKNFLSPTNQSNKQPSKAADEIYDVYENTGDKTIMPMVAPYYIQNKTVGRIDLNSKDRAEYQKISGKLVNDAVEELIDNKEYKNLSYDQKAEILNGIVTYANAKAKQHFTGYMANTYNSADKKIDSGMSIADYYLEKTKKKR